MDEDRKRHWDQIYGTKADRELSWHQDRPEISLELARLAGLGEGTSVVDIGGGTSGFAGELIALGVRDVTVVDISAEALAASRRRLGAEADAIGWITADITAWTPPRTYDLWHDRAVFHFLTEAGDRAAYLERLGRAVPSGGHVIIGTFALDGPETCSGLPVVRYSPENLGQALGARYAPVAQRFHVHHTPWGRPQSFQFSLFRVED